MVLRVEPEPYVFATGGLALWPARAHAEIVSYPLASVSATADTTEQGEKNERTCQTN